MGFAKTAVAVGDEGPRCAALAHPKIAMTACYRAGMIRLVVFLAIGAGLPVARGESKRTSDIDILIELDPQAAVGLFEYVGITQYLADLFPVRVDVANRSSLKPLVRPSVERDALYAF